MDLFFGLEKPVLNEEGIALLATLYDDMLVSVYESLLKEEDIKYLKKDRSGGGALRILTGSNLQGTDIYVSEADLARARALFELEATEDAENDTEEATK